jgi:hypothetical protein
VVPICAYCLFVERGWAEDGKGDVKEEFEAPPSTIKDIPQRRLNPDGTWQYFIPRERPYDFKIIFNDKVIIQFPTTQIDGLPISEDQYRQYYKAKQKIDECFVGMKKDPKKEEEFKKRANSFNHEIFECMADFAGVSVDDIICRAEAAMDARSDGEEEFGDIIDKVREDNPLPKRKPIFGRRKAVPNPYQPLSDCLVQKSESFSSYFRETCGLTEAEYAAIDPQSWMEIPVPIRQGGLFKNRRCMKEPHS